MKKQLSTILATFTLTVSLASSLPLNAAEADISKIKLPKPEAPHYMLFEPSDRTADEGNDMLSIVRRSDKSVVELSAEYYSDIDAFLEKYGLYDFYILMQYDSSLDGTDNWNYTPEWDTDYLAVPTDEVCASVWIDDALMERFTLLDLYFKDSDDGRYNGIADALIHRNIGDFDNYYFDVDNHSLSIRCRYFMYWEVETADEIVKYSTVSDWSDIAVFGKGGNSVTPTEPSGYAAPVISNLRYEQPTESSELGNLLYDLSTPESVWEAQIYYTLTENGSFDTLETQIALDGGDWQEYETVNSWSDWGLSEGTRHAHAEEPRIEADSEIKLRVRYVGTHGESEWSNVLELKGGGTQQLPEGQGGDGTQGKPSDDKCSLCGFCPVPLGLCIFIWLAILLAVIVIIVIILIVVKSKSKKCKQCGTELEKQQKFCPKCGAPIK